MNKFEEFKSFVEHRVDCYNEIETRTVVVENDSGWRNLHTDVYLQASDETDVPSQSTESSGPFQYLNTKIEFSDFDDFNNLIESISDGTCHEHSIDFGIETGSGDDWENDVSVHHTPVEGVEKATRAARMQIVLNDDTPSSELDQFERSLRKNETPYISLDDFIHTYLGHTLFNWGKTQVRITAPVYLMIRDAELAEGGRFSLNVETHESIEDLTISTWGKYGDQITDRTRYEEFELESSTGPFHVHKLESNVAGKPNEVSYSIFHEIIKEGELRDRVLLSQSVLFQTFEGVLGLSSEKVSQILDELVTNEKDIISQNRLKHEDDFVVSIISLLNLAGFSAYSPEWYDPHAVNQSLPDVVASTKAGFNYRILIWECSTNTAESEMRRKVDNATSNAERLEMFFTKLGESQIEITPVYATPTRNVATDLFGDSIQILTGEKLVDLRKMAMNNTQTDEILKELF